MKLPAAAAAGAVALAAVCLVCSHLPGRQHSPGVITAYAAQSIPIATITISSAVPDELNKQGGGAPGATLQQAAAFACPREPPQYRGIRQSELERRRDRDRKLPQ